MRERIKPTIELVQKTRLYWLKDIEHYPGLQNARNNWNGILWGGEDWCSQKDWKKMCNQEDTNRSIRHRPPKDDL